jgi:cation transport ATPase
MQARTKPSWAHRRNDAAIEDVPIERLAIGDTTLVRAGEIIPVDGIIRLSPQFVGQENSTDHAPIDGDSPFWWRRRRVRLPARRR